MTPEVLAVSELRQGELQTQENVGGVAGNYSVCGILQGSLFDNALASSSHFMYRVFGIFVR